jgi:predicted HicB family RNase H-like nuclease
MKLAQLTLRLPDETHSKLRILAAFKNVSQNDLILEAVLSLLTQWEQKHGLLPLPPEDID